MLSNDIKATTFTVTDTKLFAPIVTLPIQEIQSCLNNQNQVLKEQSFGTNKNQK